MKKIIVLNLLLVLSVGAVGFVSVCGHTVGAELRAMLDAWFAGNSNTGTNYFNYSWCSLYYFYNRSYN